jgi:hypothetical protein
MTMKRLTTTISQREISFSLRESIRKDYRQ